MNGNFGHRQLGIDESGVTHLPILVLLLLCLAGAGVAAESRANENTWRKLSSANGDIPVPGASDGQPSSQVFDINGDGLNDFVLASWRYADDPLTTASSTNAVHWYEYSAAGWIKHLIDGPVPGNIEAGGAHFDIDADGDLDLVFGESGTGDRLWWWENPAPNFDKHWPRRLIKKGEGNQYHDQLFADFDQDGDAELISWNQRAGTLWMFEIPADPRSDDAIWVRNAIYEWNTDPWDDDRKMEGLAAADIDQDGHLDIVGAGHWWKRFDDGTFAARVIDKNMKKTRVAIAQLVVGGAPEVIFVPGDGSGNGYWYQWIAANEYWQKTLLEPDLIQSHTLAVGDIDRDGHLDIFVGEMGRWELADNEVPQHPNARMLVFYGDGKGKLARHVIHVGQGTHEGRLADLDGDGDLDILVKPFKHNKPLVEILLNEKAADNAAYD